MIFNPHKIGLHKILKHTPGRHIIREWLNSKHNRELQNNAETIQDLRLIAKNRAHKMIFDYLDGGCDDEITMRRNSNAFEDYELFAKTTTMSSDNNNNKPQSSGNIDLSTTLFGRSVQVPFFGCPTAGNKMFHLDGEEAVAKAATQFGSLYALSALSTTSIERISQICPNQPKVFQLYAWRDREIVKDVLSLAKQHNFDGLAITVDVSWMGNRERDLRNGFSVPPNYSWNQTYEAIKRPAWTFDFLSNEPYSYACINKDVPAESMVSFINSQLTPDFNWNDAEWVLGEWGGSAALKGVIRPDDAIRGVEMGFTTIWISNHGGRQLDTSPPTLDVLPSIRDAVGSKSDIILDGGIQCGSDILKAIALGADGAGVGKAYLWGLTAGGTDGVLKSYSILQNEMEAAMETLGISSIDEIKERGPDLVKSIRNDDDDNDDVIEEEEEEKSVA